ncbi:tetratricopeptide repeat protein [Azospirillum sp. TSO22-1]|uniref:tetratricopeptide repeat protein n=1 Tax=Azospirillum sp. TSO22-1 TaxID=716789 RepID=UPI000D612D77|nr:tetratricopeptide repeat protein [Azospirillum sp. TSO22-1]PWC35731.1 hypothetical protein TSO221_29090 [Azospirillum sp. TSO22-1]
MTGDPNALLALAARSHAAGDFATASGLCDRVLALAPLHPDALMIKGLAARRSGRPGVAAALLRAALAAAPDHAGVWSNLADLDEVDGRADAALAGYRRVNALAPGDPRALAALLRLHTARWELDAAAALARVMTALSPERPELHAHLGELASVAGRHGDAPAPLRRAARLAPHNAAFHHTLGLALLTAWEEGAIGPLRRALALQPDLADAWVALGDQLTRDGDVIAAHGAFHRAAALRPDEDTIRSRLRFAEIRIGRYEEWWHSWNATRPYDPGLPGSLLRLPLWEGEDASGSHLLVTGEEGLGDEILFASCLPDVITRPVRVTLACNPRLARLFARSFPGATVVPATATASLAADRRIALGGLPAILRRTPASFPDRASFLTADPTMVADWRSRLGTAGQPIVGLSWHTVASETRCVSLQDLADALAAGAGGPSLVSLQYGDHAAALAAAADRTGVPIADAGESGPGQDLDDWTARVAACDLVITIDNTTAHMAGALGVETWVLLPVEAEIRWEFDRTRSPWYPSAKLFRQPRPGDWPSVLVEVGRAFGLWRRDPQRA